MTWMKESVIVYDLISMIHEKDFVLNEKLDSGSDRNVLLGISAEISYYKLKYANIECLK